MSLLDINVDGFSSAKPYQQQISHLHVMKKTNNFPKKSDLLKLIPLVKIRWRIFCVVSGVERKNVLRSEKAHFLVSQLDFMLQPMPCTLVLCVSLLASSLLCV